MKKSTRIMTAIGASTLALTLSVMSLRADSCGSKAEGATCGPKNIVDTAVGAGQFKTLAAALQAAGLVDALKGEGPYTVFAPTDEAFAKLPAGTVEALLQDVPRLQAVLKYHVVAGKVTAADVVTKSSAKTLQGQAVKIDASEGVRINTARVVKPDVMASNGVIHVIDTVLLPPQG